MPCYDSVFLICVNNYKMQIFIHLGIQQSVFLFVCFSKINKRGILIYQQSLDSDSRCLSKPAKCQEHLKAGVHLLEKSFHNILTPQIPVRVGSLAPLFYYYFWVTACSLNIQRPSTFQQTPLCTV